MKYLPHIALPLLMIGLLSLASILPKFVQKPTTQDSTTVGPPSKPLFNLPPATEASVVSKPIINSKIEEPKVEPIALAKEKIDLVPAPVETIKMVETATVESTSKTVATPDYDKIFQPFLAKLETGDLDGAEKILNGFGSSVPEGMKTGFRFSLNSARQSQQALAMVKAESAKAVNAMREAETLSKAKAQKEIELAKVNALSQLNQAELSKAKAEAARLEQERSNMEDRFKKLQNDSATKIQSSIIELTKATEAAKRAAQQAERSAVETSKLRAAFESKAPIVLKQSAGMTTAAKPTLTVQTPIQLPATHKIQFGNNSSVLPTSAASKINEVAAELKKESRLGIQLRGYADSVGNPEYNAILSRARSQRVQDALTAKGISEDRIEVLPFGSSLSPKGRSGAYRRVDMIFYQR